MRRGPLLLQIAREALEEAVAGAPRREPPPEPWLEAPGATFVTLRLAGALRGCIGSLAAIRPLAEDLRANARAAALEDPRFPAVTADELPRLTVEVSLLSPLEVLSAASERELLRRLRPGRDGLLLEDSGRRGTFLPQVWESLPEPAAFLAQLRRKAGLPDDHWSPDLRFWRFTVRKWSEEGWSPGGGQRDA